MRIIVTGGAGFIGSAMCRYLVGTGGATVLNIDKLTYAANLNSLDAIAGHCQYQFRQADICDRADMELAVTAFQPNAVVHLAAESHVDRSISGSDAFISSNIVGTYTLLQVARAYWSSLTREAADRFRFLHVSTDEVYGSLAEGLFSERSPYAPSSPYSASKAASNHLVAAWHRTWGLPTLICNCSNNYGPYQNPEKLIPRMIISALDGKPLPLYGDGMNVRDWLHVDDHVRALDTILRRGRPGDIFNVGGLNEQTNIAVVERICALVDRRRPANAPHRRLITYIDDRLGHDRRYAIDASKVTSELGWRPQRDFAMGIESTVDWYLDNTGWWKPMTNPSPRRANGALEAGEEKEAGLKT